MRLPGPVRVPEPKRVPVAEKNCIRADFLRFLLLGGDDFSPVHERGVTLVGAYIEGVLDLGGCSIPAGFRLQKCYFPKTINALDARVAAVFNLSGSLLAEGLYADRLKCAASVFLRLGFTAKDEVRLLGAQIGGNLDCGGASFDLNNGIAFNAGKAKVAGSVFLRRGFSAKSEVRLLGAQIGGNLDCGGAYFRSDQGVALVADGVDVKGDFDLRAAFIANGEVRLLGAQIGGDLNCVGVRFKVKEGENLSIDNAVVRGAWFLRKLPRAACIGASYANVAVLVDDLAAWANDSMLDGFRYGALGGVDPVKGNTRLKWLLRQPDMHLNTEGFRPQPWRQLQRVLRDMGHTEDAKLVGIALEDHLRKIGRMGEWPNDPCDLVRGFKGIVTRSAHYIFGKLAGYGYRPVNLVMWMLTVWLLCAGFYWALAQPPFNAIAPSDPLVFQNPRYSECRPMQGERPESAEKRQGQGGQVDATRTIGNWPLCSDMPGEYSTFSPWAYSLDLLLPVVDLGQEKSWGAYIPSVNESEAHESILNWRWGYFVRFVAWFQTLFGWLSSLLLVAIISGFSRRNDEG